DEGAVRVVKGELGRQDPGDVPVRPAFLFLLADDAPPRSHQLPLVLERLPGVARGEEVGVGLAAHRGRVAQAELLDQAAADAREATLGVLEVDLVGYVV